jgi:long-subunit acyl-CoA synthetase (AMP-forming)
MKIAIQPLLPGANIIVNVTPSLLNGIQAFNYYLDNYYIALDLKQYRPQRRPIVPSMLEGVSKKIIKSEKFMRKRKNIVRDWMYYIVWYVRLKKILDKHKYD